MDRILCTLWLLCCATAALADRPLPVSRWLYGTPIPNLAAGRVYLIEFTHPQCGPCRKAMPHLTALAKRYADRVSVIGIFSYFPSDRLSEGEYIAQVHALRRNLGDQLDFPLALDHRDQRAYRALAPKRVGGFPTLVIIDGTGAIRWLGTSVATAGTLLADLLADKVDWEAGIDTGEQVRAGVKRSQRLYATGQRTPALEVLDSLENAYPGSAQAIGLARFRLLVADDATGATAALHALLDRDPSFHTDLKLLGRQRRTQTLGLDVGYALAERVFRHSRDPILHAYTLADLAFLHHRHGQHELAAQLIAQATARYALVDRALQSAHSIRELEGYRYLIDWGVVHAGHPELAVRALRDALAGRQLDQATAYLLTEWLGDALDGETLAILADYVSYPRAENR